MKTLKLLRHEEMLFALLRASLHQHEAETEFFKGASTDDWKLCYQLAARQGVMALAWDGIVTLPEELQLPRPLKLTWGMAVQDYEKKYERYCRTVEELTDLYLRKGIMTVLLKGVGLSKCYPVPSHREGGDIDIYTFSRNEERMTHEEANRLADKLMEEQGIEVDMHSPKHSNFYYKGIPVENHKTFLNVERYEQAVQAEALLKKRLDPQFTYLMDGEHICFTPPVDFNRLFVAFHAAQHYGAGLALHHLCDWAMIVIRYGEHDLRDLDDWHFRQGVATLTRLCNRHLGTSVPVMGGEWLADEMLDSILHPKFAIGHVPVKGKLNVLWYKARRFVYINRLNNRILKWPMYKRVWDSIVVHLRRPETIFRTNVK